MILHNQDTLSAAARRILTKADRRPVRGEKTFRLASAQGPHMQLGMARRQISFYGRNGGMRGCVLESKLASIAACAAKPCRPIHIAVHVHAHDIWDPIEQDPFAKGGSQG